MTQYEFAYLYDLSIASSCGLQANTLFACCQNLCQSSASVTDPKRLADNFDDIIRHLQKNGGPNVIPESVLTSTREDYLKNASADTSDVVGKVFHGDEASQTVSVLTDVQNAQESVVQEQPGNREASDIYFGRGFYPTCEASPRTTKWSKRSNHDNNAMEPLPVLWCAAGVYCGQTGTDCHQTKHKCPRCKEPVHGINCGIENMDDKAGLAEKIICFNCCTHEEREKGKPMQC